VAATVAAASGGDLEAARGAGGVNLYYAAYISFRIKHIWPPMALVFRLLLEGYRNLRWSNYNETICFIYI